MEGLNTRRKVLVFFGRASFVRRGLRELTTGPEKPRAEGVWGLGGVPPNKQKQLNNDIAEPEAGRGLGEWPCLKVLAGQLQIAHAVS